MTTVGARYTVAQNGDTTLEETLLQENVDITLGEGRWQISYDATDVAGNSSGVQTAEILVDGTAPTIQMSGVLAQTYLHTDAVTIAWQSTDSISGIQSEMVTLDGNSLSNGQNVEILTLKLGMHQIWISATDYAGNNATKEISFEVVVTIESLIPATQRMCDLGDISSRGVCNSLMAKLHAFLNELDAQRGKKVSEQAYLLLYADAQYLVESLLE